MTEPAKAIAAKAPSDQEAAWVMAPEVELLAAATPPEFAGPPADATRVPDADDDEPEACTAVCEAEDELAGELADEVDATVEDDACVDPAACAACPCDSAAPYDLRSPGAIVCTIDSPWIMVELSRAALAYSHDPNASATLTTFHPLWSMSP